MEYRSLGRTGIQVSPLCLGAMMFGGWGEPDHETSIATIHSALDAGINFIDTADAYSQGESEIIVGKALAGGRRDDVVLATKVNIQMGVPVDAPVGTKGDPNKRGNSRRWIVSEVENSLRRLNTDWIDLYQIHRPDPHTDIEETLGALTDLQRQGKIRAFGSSTFPAHQMVHAQWVSERRGLGRFVTEQPPYSLLVRGIEADVLPVAQEYGMGVLPWSPLAGGWLTGGYRKDKALPESRRRTRMPGPVRHVQSGQPAQTRRCRRARATGRRRRTVADSPRARIRNAASSSHRADHRPAHPRPSEIPARRDRGRAVRGHPRQDRRDRAAWVDDLSSRSGLSAAVVDRSVLEAPPHRVTRSEIRRRRRQVVCARRAYRLTCWDA